MLKNHVIRKEKWFFDPMSKYTDPECYGGLRVLQWFAPYMAQSLLYKNVMLQNLTQCKQKHELFGCQQNTFHCLQAKKIGTGSLLVICGQKLADASGPVMETIIQKV